VQEVAYGTLVEPRRRELHLRVGEALESIHRDSPAEVYGSLARHFAEADDPERAVEYLLRAGDAARAVDAQQEAIELYRRALGFMDRAGDDGRARETLLKIALTHHVGFRYAEANEAFVAAFARPPPVPERLDPTERIVLAFTAAWDRVATPGHSETYHAFNVTINLFRGLVTLGPGLEVEPDLAEALTVSDDGRTYRFTLRSDALWSDGAPVSADDFAFTFARMAADRVASVFWLPRMSATALDERTLELRLDEPRNDFLHLLARPPLFAWPRHVYEQDGPDWHRSVPLVGNGPFVLVAQDDEHVVLEAAPTWSGARGNVAEVTIELEPSAAAAVDRWRRGDYDVLDQLFGARAGAAGDDDAVVQRLPGMTTWYVGLNASYPPFDDVRVRRAIAHAVDGRAAAARLQGNPAGRGGFLPPTMPGHSHRVAPGFDPDRARGLLREAGYADGRALGEIVLVCLDPWADAASLVAAELEALGAQVRLLCAADDHEADDTLDRGDAHAWIWAYGADVPDPGGGFLEPALREQYAGMPVYRDEQLARMLARAASLLDQDQRLRLYRELERIWIGEQAALIPLAYTDCFFWRRPWVTGMWANAITWSSFAEAVVRRPSAAT
jgi:ABC-type transport system substrate-binding protein